MYVRRKQVTELEKEFQKLDDALLRATRAFNAMRDGGNQDRGAELTAAERFPNGFGFTRSLNVVMQMEGGWSNHPNDPATMYGITAGTYRRAVRDGVIEAAPGGVKDITKDQARDIYYEYYWIENNLETLDPPLPVGVDLLLFDASVNQGPRRAVKFLQRAVRDSDGGKIAVDGVMGPRTANAVRSLYQGGARVTLLKHMTVRRMLHWSSLSKMATFGLGWFRRGIDVLVIAINPPENF